jgi:hypothetical protein
VSVQRSRRVVPLAVSLAVLLVVAGFLLALLGAHVDPPGYTAHPAPTQSVQQSAAAASVAPPAASGAGRSSSRPLHEVGNLVLGLYLAALVGGLLALAVFLLRALSGRSGREPRGSGEAEPRGYDLQPELVARRMSEAAAAGLDELAAEGPVADVIIACWQRLRAAAAQAGVPPVASDTPQESIARVLRAGAVSEAAARPLDTLAGLYREARFSSHEMSRGDIWVARKALQAIVAQLHPEGQDAR